MNDNLEKEIKDQMAKKIQEDIDATLYPGYTASQPQSTITLEMLQKAIDSVNALPKIDRLVKIMHSYQDAPRIMQSLEKHGFKKSPYLVDHVIESSTSEYYDFVGIMVTPSIGCRRNQLILQYASGRMTLVEITNWEEE